MTHHKLWVAGTYVFLPFILMVGSNVRAEDVIVLGPVVVEGENPKISTVVTSKEIEKIGATSLGEIFNNSPDVSVSGGGQTAAQKIFVRGLDDTSLNVTVDGARQGGGFFRHQGNLNIDPELLKAAEVEAGTGNALAGPGALGGAIRFVTKDAEDLLLPGQKNGAMLKSSLHSNDQTVSEGTALYGRPIDQFSYLLYGVKSWSDDYKAGGGDRVPQTGSEPLSGLVKVALRPLPDHELKLALDYHENNGNRTIRPNMMVEPVDPAREQEYARKTHSLNYAYTPIANPYLNFHASAYENDGTLVLMKTATGLTQEKEQWLNRGFDLRNRMDFQPFSLTYGFDYAWEKSIGENVTGKNISESADNQGLYFQGNYAATKDWSLSAGGRYDMAELKDIRGIRHNNAHFSPNFGTRYRVIPELTVFASWSEAFRGPRPVPGTALLRGSVSSADTDVEGEVADTSEAGVDANWEGWTGNITGYRTKVRRAITYGGGGGTPFDRKNGENLRVKGFKASVGYGQELWNAKLTYAHDDMKYGNRPAQPLDFSLGGMYASPVGDRFIINFDYRVPSWDLDFGWTSTVALDMDDLPPGHPKLPGYDVHDVSVTWQPSERYQLSMAVLNVFDERYMDQSTPSWYSGGGKSGTSYLYEIGRDFRLTGTVKF